MFNLVAFLIGSDDKTEETTPLTFDDYLFIVNNYTEMHFPIILPSTSVRNQYLMFYKSHFLCSRTKNKTG